MSLVTGLLLHQLRQLVSVSVFKATSSSGFLQLLVGGKQQLAERGEKNKVTERRRPSSRASKSH